MKAMKHPRDLIRRTAAMILCLSLLWSVSSTAVFAGVPDTGQFQSGESLPENSAEPPPGGPESGDSSESPSDSADLHKENEKKDPVQNDSPPPQNGSDPNPSDQDSEQQEGPEKSQNQEPADPHLNPDTESQESENPEDAGAEGVNEIPVSQKSGLSSAPPIDPNAGICPHHPEHTESCGYLTPEPEVPCDQGCTDDDGDGIIDHAEGCAYRPPKQGRPCTYHCEICNPTPVVITADLPETLILGESLDLKEKAAFTPVEDSLGNPVQLAYDVRDSENAPILPANGIWTPEAAGTYQITYTAVKTIAEESIVCGSLMKTVLVTEVKEISQITLPQIKAPALGSPVAAFEASDAEAGWKAEGIWAPAEGTAGEIFTEGPWQLTVNLRPLQGFRFAEGLKILQGDTELPISEGEFPGVVLTFEVRKPLVTSLFESRTDADTLAVYLTALLPEGLGFTEEVFAALLESETQEDFLQAFRSGLDALKGSPVDEEKFQALTAIIDPEEFKTALADLITKDPAPQSHSVEGAPDMSLSIEGQLPEGRTPKAMIVPTADPAAAFALYLQFYDQEGAPLLDSLPQALTVTVTTDRVTASGYQVFYTGPSPDISILSGMPVTSESEKGKVTFTAENPGVYEVRSQVAILVDLPENAYLNDEVDLGKNLRAEPDTLNGNPVQLRIASVTLEDAPFVWDQNPLFKPSATGHYTVTYEAYQTIDGQEQILARLNKTLQFLANKTIGEMLDGDYAYISDAGMMPDQNTESQTAMRTGSAPWDQDDQRGNDSTDLNNTVRSFDIATYTVYFRSKVRKDAPCSAYKEGRIFFEFILPGDKTQTQFEIGSMGWLTAKKDIHYELGETTYEMGLSQVLRGSYIWEPSENNPTAIGESYQTLSIITRVLNLTEGTKITPKFTFWLEGNETPAEYDETGKIPRGEIVTDKYLTCSVHGDEEAKTITPTPVTVTSALRLNVKVLPGELTRNNYRGTFDFDTGDPSAPNYGAGIQDGRMISYGVSLQIIGKDPSQGMRGCQFPDGDPITFDLDFSNSFQGDREDHSTEGYEALLWSVDPNNMDSTSSNGRSLKGPDSPYIMNTPQSVGPTHKHACYQGGDWTVSTVPGSSKLSITVQNYEFDLERAIPFPYNTPGHGYENYIFYTPKPDLNYWEIYNAHFSTGKLFFVQPFYNAAGEYICDKYNDSGTFHVQLEGSNLMASSIDTAGGRKIYLDRVADNSNQVITTDDFADYTCWISRPGNIESYVHYNRTENPDWDTSLTEGCFHNGKDWILRGGKLILESMTIYDSFESQERAVAVDQLIKFDNSFLDPTGAYSNFGKILYGAKPDGSGWNHMGVPPENPLYDQEMRSATADDLVFYDSLSALNADGKVCVAVLYEIRYVCTSSMFHIHNQLFCNTRDDPDLDDHVYMVTQCCTAWSRGNVEDLASQHLGIPVKDLVTADYTQYMTEAFPSRSPSSGSQRNSYADYPDPFWIKTPEVTPGLQNYQKSVYDENGYKTGTSGRFFGDSCLVVGYSSSIRKNIAQTLTTDNQTEKKAFDLDVNQRVADYVIRTQVNRGTVESTTVTSTTDTAHIRDTLPVGLTYIPGSSYWGGTYQQSGEGRQGTILNGRQLPDPIMTYHTDGTVTLEWVIADVEITNQEVSPLPPLYYSCDIGTPGNEETDVQNNQSLLNTATVKLENEQKRDFLPTNLNMTNCSILISKNQAVSISKLADQSVVEPGETMGFTMNVGNNGQTGMDVIALDSLPWNGDPLGSSFDGICQVTELTLLGKELPNWDSMITNNFKFYYTEDQSLRNVISEDLKKADFAGGSWNPMALNTDGTVDLPAGEFAPVAIAAVGTLPGNATLKIHISLKLPDGKPGSYIANKLTSGDMESVARSYVVSRTLEGLVFLDQDGNGLRAYDEPLHNDAYVTLYKLKDGGNKDLRSDYAPYPVNGSTASIPLGQQMDLLTGNKVAYAAGRYKFINLPEGTFAVTFNGGISNYLASPPNQGTNDAIDSDAIPTYASDGSLTDGFIPGIVMPPKDQIKAMVYTSRDHDMGLMNRAEFRFTKVAAEDTDLPLKGAEFKLFRNVSGDLSALLDPEDPTGWVLVGTETSGDDGVIHFAGLLPGDYRLVETKAPAGRLLPLGQWSFTVTLNDITGLPQAIGDKLPPAFASTPAGSLKLPNMQPPDIPKSGGRGTFLFGLGGTLLSGAGILLFITAVPQKRRKFHF